MAQGLNGFNLGTTCVYLVCVRILTYIHNSISIQVQIVIGVQKYNRNSLLNFIYFLK